MSEGEITLGYPTLAEWVMEQGDADRNSLPLLLIDPWGALTPASMQLPSASVPLGVQAHLEPLEQHIAQWRKTYRVWQVGFINDSALAGCDYYFLNARTPRQVRRMEALVKLAQAFWGPQSALMPLAREAGLEILSL